MSTPEELEKRHTLLTAVGRYDTLRVQDALAAPDDFDDGVGGAPLSRAEALELLALGEVLARKAAYGRQLSVRSARRAGASWSQIGAALGMSKQAAWELHSRWIDDQTARHRNNPLHGLDDPSADAARTLAGDP